MMQQHPNAVAVVGDLFQLFGPFKLIIEIGTGTGEWTNFLSMYGKVQSYDVVDRREGQSNYIFHQQNVFQTGIKDVYKCNLLICDGGNKVNEMRLFAPQLKSGSLVMVHDYGPTDTWKWCEFRDTNIPDCIQQIKSERLKSVAWFLGVKK